MNPTAFPDRPDETRLSAWLLSGHPRTSLQVPDCKMFARAAMEVYVQKRPGVHGHRHKYLSLRCLQKAPWMPVQVHNYLLFQTPPSTEPLAWMSV